MGGGSCVGIRLRTVAVAWEDAANPWSVSVWHGTVYIEEISAVGLTLIPCRQLLPL